MADLQFSTVVPMLTDDASTSSAAESAVESEQLDFATISQIILKLTQSAAPSASGIVPSEQVLDAMQRLIAMITQLRSPTSSWDSELPQTPETIAPYVTEEAYDVLEALQTCLGSNPPTPDPPCTTVGMEQSLWHHYFLVKNLAPWLLWAIARSTYEVMRLLEGIPIQAFRGEQGWQPGTLRLAATLTIKLPTLSCSFDLVTHQPTHSPKLANALIQARESDLWGEPVWVDRVLQGLVQHMQTTTPVLGQLMAGMAIDALVPFQLWQSGLLQLHVGLEFTADASDLATVETTGESPALSPDATLAAGTATASIGVPQPVIRFTDTAWIQHYATVVTRQQLAAMIPHAPTAYCLKEESLSSTSFPRLMTMVINDTHTMTDGLLHSLTLSSRPIPEREWSLHDLGLRLLWCISRSAYEVMELMGGIRASLLYPSQGWSQGVLRLLVSLKIETPELDWQLDLVTGQPPQPELFPLDADGVIQSDASLWCQQPELVENLETRVMREIKRVTPEVQLLLDGTYTDLLGTDHQWQPGTIQLRTGFEFLPDKDYGLRVQWH